MPVPSSPIIRLLPARRRTAPRRVAGRFADRPAGGLTTTIGTSATSSGMPGRRPPPSAWSWTLYSRWHWSLATARAERERRRSRA
ncbi:hypothetical protein [Actinomadura roseirufa]|uniref:hypothetical protein n=1 Tax=Actinomadura roseirufa TaxID=2094049 RepID=UPI0010410D8C|nr:hypothetical protein [Actinomadura roseirufa]